ncbi:MAG: carboxy terminal-processing peptidase [Chryseotalea sp.]
MKFRFFLLVAFFVASGFAIANTNDTTTFKPKPVYSKELQTVLSILNSYHYSKIKFNDSLSTAILQQYLLNLDGGKYFFLQSDVDTFSKYSTKLDDLSLAGDLTPAYEIYEVFRKRFSTQMDYILGSLVKSEFDFTVEEEFETNRDKMTWCKTQNELNDVWRRNIKNQALSLKLAGKKQEEITKTLTERIERMKKSILQFRSDDVFETYMNTIAEAFDPHTSYLSPKSAQRFNEQMTLSLEGIGARLQLENDYTKIAEIIPGGPAEKMGILKVNDRIVGVAQGVDGEMVDVVGWRLDDVVKLIKGPKGTTVRISYISGELGLNSKPLETSMVREKIKLEDQRAKKDVFPMIKDGKAMKMGVISIPGFYIDWDAMQRGEPNYTSTTRDVEKLLKELEVEKVDGVIIDLRNNGGGSLLEAIELTGLFINKGPVVQVRNSMGRVEVGKDDNAGLAYTGPLVVMTNRFSASASEIFAGAIQDYGRGVVVGETTFGKGTVQSVQELKRYVRPVAGEEVGSLKLTFQKFYRVTGNSTQHRGVTPDIAYPSVYDAQLFGESSNPSALPWDQIKGTLYERTGTINKQIIQTLAKNHAERIKTDPLLKKLVLEAEESRRAFQDSKVSLKEETRKKKQDEAEQAKNKAALTTTIGNKEGISPATQVPNVEDGYLYESILILSELATSRVG